MPERAKKPVSGQIAEKYEKLFSPADDLVKDAWKPRGSGPEAYMKAVQKVEHAIGEQERQGNRNPAMYAAAARAVEGYIGQMPQKPEYAIARKNLKDALTRYEFKARHR
jgi:hypothetical protein